jgi:DNA-binding CsgD family transcriptional regulator
MTPAEFDNLEPGRSPLSFEQLIAVAGKVELTPRELEFFLLIFGGKSYKEAARDMRIKPRTARFHCENLRGKFKAVSDAQIILRVFEIHRELGGDI